MIVTYEMLKDSLKNYKAPDIKISRMCKNQDIIKLTKNLYCTSQKLSGYVVANAIYSPSYLSFDYALAYYGLIPEAVYVYTSATYKKNKTKKYENKLGTFLYRDIPSSVYPFGIRLIKEGDYTYAIASPEKALCDKLYTIKPMKNKKEMYNLLFDDLRIDKDLFTKLNYSDLIILCDLYKSTNIKLLTKVVKDYYANNT